MILAFMQVCEQTFVKSDRQKLPIAKKCREAKLPSYN